MQTEEELTTFFAPLSQITQKHGQGPNRTVEMLYAIVSRLAAIRNKVDRETRKTCMEVNMLKVFSLERDRKAALPDGEDTTMAGSEKDQHPENGSGDVPAEPAADENEKEDEGVAAIKVMDEVIVRAIIDTESLSSTQHTKAVMAYSSHARQVIISLAV